jgi:hypothetical protein
MGQAPAYEFWFAGRRMDDKAEKVALLRYGLIAPLVLETLPPRRTHQARPADHRPPLPHSHSTRRLNIISGLNLTSSFVSGENKAYSLLQAWNSVTLLPFESRTESTG